MKTPPPPLHELILARGFADFPAGVTKEQVLATLGRAACEEALVPPGRVAEVLSSLRANEQMMSSGMGGVAIPHVRHPAVARDAVRVGRVRDGLAFDSLDGRPVHLVFLILLPAGEDRRFLEIMPAILAALRPDARRDRVLSSPDATTFVERFFAAE